MAPQGKWQQSKVTQDPYSLNRDAKESARKGRLLKLTFKLRLTSFRLNLQHRLIVESCNFLVHPIALSSIFASKPSVVRIADFATGTAIWPDEVAKLFSSSYPHVKVEIEGFDISTKQFPPSAENLPNVKLMRHDVLQPMKEKYHGKYDCIHVRGLVTVLEDDQWAKVIATLKKCLKPGGWLIWIDPDMSTRGWKSINLPVPQPVPFSPYVPLNPVNSLLSFQIPNPLQVGIVTVNKWAYNLGRHLSCSNRLSDFFAEQGLQQIRHERVTMGGNDLESQKTATEQNASGVAAIIYRFAKMLGKEVDFDPNEMVREMMECCQEGLVWTRMDLNVVVGRKPGWTDLPRGTVVTENVYSQLPGHKTVEETFRKGPIPDFDECYEEKYVEDDQPDVGDARPCTTMEGFDKGLVRKRQFEEDAEEEQIWKKRCTKASHQSHEEGRVNGVLEEHQLHVAAQANGNFEESAHETPPGIVISAPPDVSNSHQGADLQDEICEENLEQ
ncbi:hypothetical protein BJ875DRAFT_93727 [Amylocarpus encephaloides]|uniref:Methyltransferase domain-containing protein n=1 Tax=Amylocarpus encephaloides TaxID=45428 RepID=A0A9P7YFJ5_9HELO|nr:hypothetical protein BJ875DRAFT_93727 [Amylocarpus encephaloides]